MSFTSVAFAVFLPALLLSMALVRGKQGRELLLLLGGVFFYGWWNWRFLALIGFTSVFDFFLALAIARAPQPRRRRLLALDIAVNLGLLATFKYLGFFVANVNALGDRLGFHLPAPHVLLPIGISFFVFEAMSYCIDVYRGKLEPYTNWLHFGLFIFFFPRMVAGPIIRAADFLPQVRDRAIAFTADNVNRGACQFLLGLSKKVLIADRLALLVDPVFARPSTYDSPTVWAATIAYSFQIFCDFSGYSDMAIGLARIFGIELPINFDLPYLSTSITEFWRRWHISLSSWLRDYLYISLGGNRRGEARTYANLMITMLLGGLWHGASWNFVVWGGLHGLFLAVHKMIGARTARRSPLDRALSTVGTFALVTLAWVPFRASSFAITLELFRRLFFLDVVGVRWIYEPFWLTAALVIGWHIWRRNRGELGSLSLVGFRGWLVIWTLAYLMWFAAPLKSQPFIYFQF